MANYKKLSIVLLALFMSSTYIYLNFPKAGGYYTGADEGTYYRQAVIVREHGLRGFQIIADDYLTHKELQVLPNPLRIMSAVINAVALSLNDSYFTLSLVSLFCFVALCLLSYYYICRIWGSDLAATAVLLLCFSPLASAMAKRALIDSQSYLVSALLFFSFLDYVINRQIKRYYLFCCMLIIVWLNRETGFLYYPFFLFVLLYLKRRVDLPLAYGQIFAAFAASAAVVAVVYFAIFGPQKAFDVLRTIFINNIQGTPAYVKYYQNGPWYRYLIDFMIISPITMITAFLYTGFFLLGKDRDRSTGILLFFLAYLIFVYSFLQMNVRYVMIMDLLIRLLSALAVLQLLKSLNMVPRKKSALVVAIMAVIIAVDARSFTRHFVTSNTYDPVSYNLLYTERFIPVDDSSQPAAPTENDGAEIADPRQTNKDGLTAKDYLNLSLKYYREKKYPESVEMATKALQIKPDFAEAYNNICAAYNEMKQWDKAIEAGEMAVRLDPDNQLARNNLAWAKSERLKKRQ